MKQIIFIFSFAFLVLAHQNCSQTPFGALGLSSDDSGDFSSTGDTSGTNTAPYALLSAEQLFKSMESVTGVPANSGIINEYRARANLFASGNELNLITSPMQIGAANLASTFCNELISRESAIAIANASQRKFFNQIDFSRPVREVKDEAFQESIVKMSQAFWGRSPSSLESDLLMRAKTEFLAELSTAELGQANFTRNLALFTCTGMLASFESMTF